MIFYLKFWVWNYIRKGYKVSDGERSQNKLKFSTFRKIQIIKLYGDDKS